MRDNTDREGIKFTHSRDLLHSDNENRRHHGREA